MKSKKRLTFVLLAAIGVLITYLVLAKGNNIWSFQKPLGLVRDEILKKKYGKDYKPIRIYVKVEASEEEITLLKNRLQQFPDVLAVEVFPWPKKSKSGHSAAVRLIPMVKRDPNGFDGYPSNILDFLHEGETNPSSPTSIINSLSFLGEP